MITLAFVQEFLDEWAKDDNNIQLCAGHRYEYDHEITLPPALLQLVWETAEKIRDDVQSHFHSILPPWKSKVNGPLDLAISLFKHKNPKLYVHHSMKEAFAFSYPFAIRTPDSMPATQFRSYGESPPALKDAWLFDTTSSAIVKAIVLACEKDPMTCTFDELAEMEPYVSCLTCNMGAEVQGVKYGPTMHWEQAVSVSIPFLYS